MTNAKVKGKALREVKRTKIAKWVKFSYVCYFIDGSNKLITDTIAQLEGHTNFDTVEYLMKDFKDGIKRGEFKKVKLLAVDGEKLGSNGMGIVVL